MLEYNNGSPNIIEIRQREVTALNLDPNSTHYVISSDQILDIVKASMYLSLCHTSWNTLYKREPSTSIDDNTEVYFPIDYRREWNFDTVDEIVNTFKATHCVKRSVNDWTDDFTNGYSCLENRRVSISRNSSTTAEIGIIKDVINDSCKVEFADSHQITYPISEVNPIFIYTIYELVL
jgi:alpha-L-arabinofuranosidase